MSERIDYLVQRLADQGALTLSLFRGLTPEQWQTPIYTEGTTWDVRTLLSHFVSSEQSLVKLLQNVVAGGSGTPEDFDLNRFNAGRAASMASLSPDNLIQRFEQGRAATIAYIQTLDDADLDRQGRHATEGVQPLEMLIKIVYKHNQVHEIDLRNALGIPQPERRPHEA